ncbi:MAG: class I SAM-dependent methyltransferase, partial [Pelagibacterales bacterium]|nr:class I SAM-dependent methyltransferase [Pelagibacterales bacterium]
MIKSIKQGLTYATTFFKKSSIWTKVVAFVIIALIFTKIANANSPRVEGFSQNRKFVVKKNNEIYDNFYCSVYDHLVYDEKKNDFEVIKIDKIAKINNNSKVLDLGCGNGHYVNFYKNRNVEAKGIDKSKAMIKNAKKLYPNCSFKNGDFLDGMNYQNDTFSHALCLYFTVYYVKNKRQLFENVYKWLEPGGFLILHLVNRDEFDPILPPSDPLVMVSAQKFAKKRITKSQVKFDDFMYKSNFTLIKDKNVGKLEETFTDDATHHVR